MKRIFPLGLVTLGMLLSGGTLSQWYLDSRASSSETIHLPKQLAGLSTTDSQVGTEAIYEFADLHGNEFPITSGAVGIYGNGQITLWVAGTSSEGAATQLTNAMQGKIAAVNSPFKLVNEINDSGRHIYALEGMGQKRFYFQSGHLVIWLAADPGIADNALQQTLEAYP